MERLDKFLCDSGVGTRSQVKAILKSGRVTVDGKPEKDNSRKIDPNTQVICLDGESLCGKRRIVVMLNKPAGYVTATEDPVEKTVMELLRSLDSPCLPAEIDVDETMLKNTFMFCKEVRARYTILQMVWDLGLLDQLSDQVIKSL